MPTTAFKSAVFAAETAEALIVLVTIDHAALAEPIRVSSDAVATVSRGDTFVAFPFEIELPDSTADAPPRARLRIDNVDRQIVAAVREMTSSATVTVEVVRPGDPDTVEMALEDFTLADVRYDSLVVEGVLSQETFLNEPYPARSFGPADFPGLF